MIKSTIEYKCDQCDCKEYFMFAENDKENNRYITYLHCSNCGRKEGWHTFMYPEVRNEKKETKKADINWGWIGADQRYHVYVNGDSVFQTKEPYQRDMFIAELKARLASD